MNIPEHKLIPPSLRQLIEKVSKLPDEYRVSLMEALDAVTEDTMRRRELLAKIKDSLEDLRFSVKYLMLDLEATRRERDEALK